MLACKICKNYPISLILVLVSFTSELNIIIKTKVKDKIKAKPKIYVKKLKQKNTS